MYSLPAEAQGPMTCFTSHAEGFWLADVDRLRRRKNEPTTSSPTCKPQTIRLPSWVVGPKGAGSSAQTAQNDHIATSQSSNFSS